MPDGLDSCVGSTIKQLSSGQKQRISIARLFYSDRDILIFDEATNALDEKNEKSIFDNLFTSIDFEKFFLAKSNFFCLK